MRIGLVAGESSGDLLGAGLIKALNNSTSDLQSEGVAGPNMIREGCKALFPSEKLSIIGLVEALANYRELRAIRNQLRDHFIANPPDAFIGIDAPDFNLTLLEQLREKGIPTIQYVSPQVWAWRRYRVRKIARAVDCVLALFPFEAEFYREHDVPVQFVGHPFADQIPLATDKAPARVNLNLPENATIIAMLPGSRVSEVRHLAETFLKTANYCYQQRKDIHFVIPFANQVVRDVFIKFGGDLVKKLPLTFIDGQAREVMGAADVILMASGTATLEAMLVKRPMVVAYRLSWLNYIILKTWVRVKNYSLPNLLAGEALVPEYMQGAAQPDVMGEKLLQYLNDPDEVSRITSRFTDIHHTLRQNTDKQAADAVINLIKSKKSTPNV
ncbi:MAG: lipid-A-disaccharide synthase [Sulfuriflexus sp.]|nr:lipid-A-disaccharide synthase [Sulfuriflexus sp.]